MSETLDEPAVPGDKWPYRFECPAEGCDYALKSKFDDIVDRLGEEHRLHAHPNVCPECTQGKHDNCTHEAMNASEEIVPCDCETQEHVR